jgi:TolB protein
MLFRFLLACLFSGAFVSFAAAPPDSLVMPGEVQLTFGGNNAEAYFSADDRQLTFQSDWDSLTRQGCDQIFTMSSDPEKKGYAPVSTGRGRTTCSFFLGDGRVIYASTHRAGAACPVAPPRVEGKYVWPVYESFDIFVFDPKTQRTEPFISGPGYDAEAVVSPDGKFVLFTSDRTGDLELWRYEIKTKKLLQITNTLGYDGGGFFSADGKQIIWRASRPNGEAATIYRSLLAKHSVEPTALNVFIADADGQNARQVTNLPGANWAPFLHPSGKFFVFASNHHTMAKGGREFAIFRMNVDGTGLAQVTHSKSFEAFAMFSRDGKRIVFSSNRNNKGTRDTNVFIADWVD